MTAIALQQRTWWPFAHLLHWSAEAAFTLATGALIAATLGIGFLDSPNLPTGGDAASHLLYTWLYSNELLFSGQVTPWIPEVFGGLPFLSYYFPLPFVVIAVLSKLLGVAPAFKWGAFLPSMLLPGAVFTVSRRWLHMSWPAAFFGALGALGFLLHEQNSIWGGNLLSTLSGEFAYSYGVLFAVLAMLAWTRAVSLGRGWVVAGVLEAACGFSHGFPLLVVGFSTVFLLLDTGSVQRARATFGLLLRGHLLAFLLLGGWLWPMLEMHSLTIPNDGSYQVTSWVDLLPKTLWPIAAAGISGLALLAIPAIRRCWTSEQACAARYFAGAAGVAAVGFIAGDQIGVADVRFFPLVWVLGAIVCGWLFGQALSALGPSAGQADAGLLETARVLVVAAASLGALGWFAQNIHAVPDWALWNHSGLEAKPQWNNLSRLFPVMRGDLWRPRILFEHDPANNDIGSTRSLEALPMFLNHRPVLEGLYMESAVLGPAVYQAQSEVSARPSSPLVRFPAGSLDPQFAAKHMEFLHADTLLTRSTQAREAIEASGLFLKVGEALPFSLYRLKQFDSHLAQVVTKPLRFSPTQEWMQDAFTWFHTRSRFDAYQPVYGDPLPTVKSLDADHAVVREKVLSRNELVFETDAVGSAHLIKVAYHPRWHLESKGSLRIAAPGFMLVVPEEREIRLVYGHTRVGTLGMIATISAVLGIPFFAWRRRAIAGRAEAPLATRALPWQRHGLLLAGWVVLAAAGVYFGLRSPERVYNMGWYDMGAQRYAQASAQFARAYESRRPPAKKEEALFWSAKSSELAGNRTEAKKRYRELCERYHGYWLPESLYMVAVLERQDGRAAEAEPYIRRLREEYPSNKWTRKLDEVK